MLLNIKRSPSQVAVKVLEKEIILMELAVELVMEDEGVQDILMGL